MTACSIIIPTYNRAQILGRTLESIISQTSPNWECIIVDDFSTDNTKDIVQQFCDKDSRFHYIVNQRSKGAQGARNTGLIYATNEWVMLFDSDNIMHSDLIESMLMEIEKRGNKFNVYTCYANVINFKTNKIEDIFEWECEGDIHKKILCGETYVDFNIALVQKTKIEEIGWLDEGCPSMQEWDTHIRLSKIAKYHTIPKCMVDYYRGGSDTISNDVKREIMGDLYLFAKHKEEWSQYLSAYWMYGERTIGILETLPCSSFRKEHLRKVHKLMPGLRNHLLKKKGRMIYRSLRHKLFHTTKPIFTKC